MAGMRDKLIHDYIQVSEDTTPLLIDIENVYNTLLNEDSKTTN